MTVCLFTGEINALLFNNCFHSMKYYVVNMSPFIEELFKSVPLFLYAYILKPKRQEVLQNAVSLGVGFAIFENAKKIQTMPNGFTFGGTKIPSYRKAISLALKAHESMPMLGIIGWDITIDSNNKPVFIEWNLRGIGMYHSQLTMGPLFGPYSDYFAEIAKKMIKGKKV